MSKLKSVVVASETLLRPMQDYEHLVCWYNIPPMKEFWREVYDKRASNCDVFGFIPEGLFFSDEESVSKIMSIFNQKPHEIGKIESHELSQGEPSFFINKRCAKEDNCGSLTLKGIVRRV